MTLAPTAVRATLLGVRRELFAVVAWAACVVAGGWASRAYAPLPGVLGELASHESVHVAAHLFLYGGLALFALVLAPRPRWAAPVITLGVALLQELAQVAPWGGTLGWAGAFDLAVDTVALGLAYGARRLRGGA